MRIVVALCMLCSSCWLWAAEPVWITSAQQNVNKPNTWLAYQKQVVMKKKPAKLVAKIACDSKYWLWINGELVIFEGQLKRGPAPGESYYDEVDLAPFMKRGQNNVSVLVWYFGRSGFSHADSGKAGLIIDATDNQLDTNSSWVCKVHPAYGTATGKVPNFRLSESNIRFEANKDIANWQTIDARKAYDFQPAAEMGGWGAAPWGKLTLRPIPMFKDFGIRRLAFVRKEGKTCDTLVARMPGNLQVTPIIDVTDDRGGEVIDIWTNHSHTAGTWNVRAQYVTRQGRQTYESLGWMNGEEILLFLPKHIQVNGISYRETGYDTFVEGTFICDDAFYNRFWQKSLNTLYVNMRDTYMDCPERERAQWWGDETTLTGEAFYCLSRSADALMRKGMLELCAWANESGALHSPIPGNYEDELPGQMLAAVGLYGFWNYYMNTGDRATIQATYPTVRRYLGLWRLEPSGLTALRNTKWLWGDWGDHRDLRLIIAGWHYMALDAAARMADMLGLPDDAQGYRSTMQQLKVGFNTYWNGYCYRHDQYMGATDDRVQALAILSGMADKDKYPALFQVLKTQEYSSPYMEKYVMEALFRIGQGAYAMERLKKRIAPMVNHKDYYTLFEFWDAHVRNFKGGSNNHAWSGGGLTVISQELMGVAPLEPGYVRFKVDPQYVTFGEAALSIPTVKGMVHTSFKREKESLCMSVGVPQGTEALVYIPSVEIAAIHIDGKALAQQRVVTDAAWIKEGKTAVWLTAGHHEIAVRER